MGKSFFVDTTICTACRACQVSCKQWHGLPAEKTENRGTFENPPDLSFVTYKVVRMREQVMDGKLQWLFFPEQCRHCVEPPCYGEARDDRAIYRDEATGAVIFTAASKSLNADDITGACPYNIPRAAPDGTLAKCDMCLDRVKNGLLPACVQTCPTGAMQFGEREAILETAKKRLEEVRKTYPKATLVNPDDVRVVYLVVFDPKLYHKYAVASNSAFGITRQMAMQRLFDPIRRVAKQLG